MQRANRPIALALLLMAVLCSPAGVCVIDGMAATVQAAPPAHAHACGKSGDGTFLAASDGSCCSEPRRGFLSVLRFTLQTQEAPRAVTIDLLRRSTVLVAQPLSFDRRAPLVLRI